MTFWQLAAVPPAEVRIDWQKLESGVVLVSAHGVRCYLEELLAVPHSALWDYIAERVS